MESDWADVDGHRIYKWVLEVDGGLYVASDADGTELRDEHGDRIYVDDLGYAITPDLGADTAAGADLVAGEPKTDAASRFGKVKNLFGWKTEPDADTPQVFDSNGVPLVDFDIVKVGKAPTFGRHNRGRRALTIAVSSLAACAAVGLIAGVTIGRSAIPAEGTISAQEASAYRLTTFPLDAAVSFGRQYLDVCLTHGGGDAVKKREQLLKAMGTPGAADGCGWTSGGLQQEPALIVWDGTMTPISEFPDGEAAYLGFTVSMADGQYQTVSVPVWVKSSKVSNDMRIVGDIGVTAPMRLATPPPAKAKLTDDGSLAGQVTDSLLAPFFKAWGASDAGQLNLVLADSAVARARTGLGGIVANPKIDKATVRSPRATDTPANQPIVYQDGDAAVAEVRVTWDVPASESTQTTGYRVELVRHSGKWLVVDIRAGLVDRDGAGAAGSGIGSANELVPGAASTRGTGTGG
ncbi:conjugal transfer protein [Prescottella subtropica]|uniref:conjugal transfer protein n=1 Tax=Prescottella subtropica TaxID=2545757 RepID=UPI0010F9866E|nr:conjugal transfer protein [Prescottella subtropica]